jgi:hypothetical protein
MALFPAGPTQSTIGGSSGTKIERKELPTFDREAVDNFCYLHSVNLFFLNREFPRENQKNLSR